MLGNQIDVSNELLEKYAETENWFTFQDFYSKVALEDRFETFVEVGSWKGHSTRFLVKELQKQGKAFTFFAVDLWDRLPKDNELWALYPEQMPICRDIYNHNLIQSNTRKDVFDCIMDSVKASSAFADKSIDFLFLDASHDEEAVKKDLVAWYPKMKKHGLISGHDIHSPFVANAVTAFFADKGHDVLQSEADNVWAVCLEPAK